jgi:DNA modification methylase
VEPYLADPDLTVYRGDVLDVLTELDPGSVDCVVTSPPYWGLRDYGEPGQIGLEPTPAEYVAKLVDVFRAVRRVLSDEGTVWLNLGDTYASGNRTRYDADGKSGGREHRSRPKSTGPFKPKDLCMIPARVALALWDDGWHLRAENVWHKPNPMTESMRDRPTRSHEMVYLFAKRSRYYYDREAVLEPFQAKTVGNWSEAHHEQSAKLGRAGTYRRHYHHPVLSAPPQEETLPGLPPERPRGADGRRATARVDWSEERATHENYANAYGGERWPDDGRNMRTVWTVPVEGYPGAHFATFPRELARRCIVAGCPEGGVVLDPFAGSGTTGEVARAHGRRAVLVELSEDYCRLIAERTQQQSLLEGA